jgi:hypothetical protein
MVFLHLAGNLEIQVNMTIRFVLAVVVLGGLACNSYADQVSKISNVVIDDSAMVPKHQTLTKDTTCTSHGKCVDKLDFHLECRSGIDLRVSVVQPRGALATVTDFTNKGKSVSDQSLRAINGMMRDRPASAKAEIDGMCSSNGVAVYLATYADAFLKTRHQVGDDIVVSISTSGKESVATKPIGEP